VAATLDQLSHDDFASWFRRTSSQKSGGDRSFHVVLDFSALDVDRLEHVVAQTSPDLAPAKAVLDEEGKVVLTPEVSRMKLVRGETEKELREAIVGRGVCNLVAAFGKKDVPDEDLAKITEVVSTFGTKFNAGDRSRSHNLKIAAQKLDGVVLMPGEKFSFNEFVGERTPANGFNKAGVYRQGRHEIDWGGGVCQVSTTLFNAVVLANLKVTKRNNHTFAVPYVPLGRDAAVSYGSYDLEFVNTLETPVAIDSKYETGRLTFSVLGIKDPGLEVKLVPVVTESWSHDTVYMDDPNLAPGQEVVVEKGGKGYRAVTTKVVLRDGEEVSRETLCRSYYKGAPKIIARGKKVEPKNDTTVPIVNPGLGPG
jgi:vancomycin resistance protein YoaR